MRSFSGEIVEILKYSRLGVSLYILLINFSLIFFLNFQPLFLSLFLLFFSLFCTLAETNLFCSLSLYLYRAIGDPDDYHNACCWFPFRSDTSHKKRFASTYSLGVEKQLLTASFIAFTSTAGLGAFGIYIYG